MFGWSDPSPYFRMKPHGNVTLIHVQVPEIRHPEPAQEFGQDLWTVFGQEGHKALLLNMAKVRYFSSTAFAVLLRFVDRALKEGGVIKLCDLHPDVAVGANIIGLGRLVETFGTESEALASFPA